MKNPKIQINLSKKRELETQLRAQIQLQNNLEKQLRPIKAKIEKLKTELQKLEEQNLFPKIRKVIDEIFNNPENEDCNIVILNGVHGDSDGGRELYERPDWEETDSVLVSQYDGFGEKYNKWATAIEYSKENAKLLKKFYALANTYVPSSKKIYGDDDGVNCYWHGIVALHKDYSIVGFICRDDNMMLNEYKNSPDVLLNFKEQNIKN